MIPPKTAETLLSLSVPAIFFHLQVRDNFLEFFKKRM